MSARLFAAAYPATFLTQLRVDNLLLINNYELGLNACLSAVHKLDLTGSQLDDDHDFLSFIPHLVCLHVLILADLKITDIGLRKILLPSFEGRNLPQLSYLDLAGTAFTVKTLASLKKITQLKEILFYCDERLSSEYIKAALSSCYRLFSRPRIEQVSTAGFGAGLLDRWADVIAGARKVRQTAAGQRPAFYGALPNPVSSQQQPLRPSQRNKVMFVRTGKRPVESLEEDLPSRKRFRTEDSTKAVEIPVPVFSDILDIYR